jgi:hypothetical protein
MIEEDNREVVVLYIQERERGQVLCHCVSISTFLSFDLSSHIHPNAF